MPGNSGSPERSLRMRLSRTSWCTSRRATAPSAAARTADELARVDAGYRFARDGQFPFRGRGIGVPTLAEVLRRYRGVPTIIEMKIDTEAMGQAVAEEIGRVGAIDDVCVAGYGAR